MVNKDMGERSPGIMPGGWTRYFLGKYPEDGLKFYGSDVPAIHEKDIATIHQPLDFFGMNIYRGKT